MLKQRVHHPVLKELKSEEHFFSTGSRIQFLAILPNKTLGFSDFFPSFFVVGKNGTTGQMSKGEGKAFASQFPPNYRHSLTSLVFITQKCKAEGLPPAVRANVSHDVLGNTDEGNREAARKEWCSWGELKPQKFNRLMDKYVKNRFGFIFIDVYAHVIYNEWVEQIYPTYPTVASKN